MLKQQAFEMNTPQPIVGEWAIANSEGYKTLRKWQIEAFDTLKDRSLRLLSVPMGAGKSIEMCSLAHYDLKSNPLLKCIIAVPQRIIAEGFLSEPKIQLPDETKIDWAVIDANNLIDDGNSCINRLIAFLENGVGNPKNIFGRILVCSHQTVSLTYSRLKKENRLDLLSNLTIFIDEAHHVCGYEDEKFNVNECNVMGEFSSFIINGKNNKLSMATATFYRGSNIPVFAKDLMDKFTIFCLPFDKYLEGMQYLRSFSYNFIFYSDPVETIKEIYADGIGKSAIYIPGVTSNCRFDEKTAEVKTIFDIFGIDHKENHEGVHKGVYKGRHIQAIDLVDDKADRKRRMRHINAHAKKDTGADLIVALNMLKEGANYEYLDHECIIGPRNSLREIVQTVGRMFRDVKGKASVSVDHMLPMALANDNDQIREILNNNLKAILMSMMMENVFCKKLIIKKSNSSLGGGGNKKHDKDLSDLITDDMERINLITEIVKKAINEEANSGKGDYETSKLIIEEALADRGFSKEVLIKKGYDPEEIADQIFAMAARRSIVAMKGINVSEININLLKEVHMTGWLVPYFKGMCNADTFGKIRDLLAVRDQDPDGKKKQLLEMPIGCERPSSTALGAALINYTNKNRFCYDHEFYKKIKELQPEWFIDIAYENKKQLLEMPIGCEKPNSNKTKLGKLLINYTILGRNSYDEDFNKQIRLKQPQWFDKRSSKNNKKKLLEMEAGCKRPNRKTNNKLANDLNNYISKNSSCYDPDFDKKIREKQTQWFFKSRSDAKFKCSQKKKQLLEMEIGCERPSQKTSIGRGLTSYISKSSHCYDVEFDKMIHERHPEWFYKSETKKMELLKIEIGCKKPNRKINIGSVLKSYTTKSSSCYDPEFDKAIRERQPQWFKK